MSAVKCKVAEPTWRERREMSQRLIQAAKDNDFPLVEVLLKKETCADVQDSDGHTPLYWACCRGNVDTCHRLLRWGCDVNAKGKAGATPLMASADNGHATCLRLLLQHRSIRLDDCSDRGDTALHMAAFRGFPEIVNLLVLAKADISIHNKNNNTPLAEAFIRDKTECVNILNKAVKKQQNNDGSQSSAIQHAHSPINYHQMPKSPRSEPDECVSSDSALGLSILSSSGTYSREPECDDERNVLSGSGKVPLMNTSIDHDNENRHSSNPSHLSNGHNGFRSHDVSMYGESDDSAHVSCGSNNSSSSCYRSLIENTHSIQSTSTSNRSHSIDSNYQSSNSCAASLEDTSGPPSIYHDPTIENGNVTSIYKNQNQNALTQNASTANKRKSRNDLSLKSGRVEKDKEVVYGYNIISEAKDPYGKDSVKASRHIDSDVSQKACQDQKSLTLMNTSEMLPGLKMSSFIENLQMRVLTLEESLSQESSSKSELRKENSKLKEENMKLKIMIRNLSVRCSELSSHGSKKS